MILLLAFGCRSLTETKLSLQPRRELTESDYGDVLEDWTRSAELYEGLDSILFVHATFYSPEFRRAFLLKHPNVYGPGSEEASRLLLTRPEAEMLHEFFISVSTSDQRWNDFHQIDSIWRVTLEGDGPDRVDGKVEKIKTTANLRVIYPFINDFANTYAFRFPLTTVNGEPVISGKTERFTLRLTSALGESELVWHLRPNRSAADAPDPVDAKLPVSRHAGN